MLELHISTSTLTLLKGDITLAREAAVVTAANRELKGGGGVDGAVHRAAGPGLLSAIQAIGGCPTGGAVATEAFGLAPQGVKHVIHAVGPKWKVQPHGAAGRLDACYRNTLRLAESLGVTSIAFPSISTGIFGFPLEWGARIAMQRSVQHLCSGGYNLKRIRFYLFNDESYDAFVNAVPTGAGRLVVS